MVDKICVGDYVVDIYHHAKFYPNYCKKNLTSCKDDCGWITQQKQQILPRSSAIAEGPRDASCQLKSCQLPRNSAETICSTNPEQIEVMKLERYSGPMCNKRVHSTMTRSSRFHCLIVVINKPTTDGDVDITYTDDLLWRNFLSPQCRNCSREMRHALTVKTVLMSHKCSTNCIW